METPHALVKDLRSTGYFFDELKKYSLTPEMDVTTYCSDFATPYLLKTSDSYDKSGQPNRSKILRLAIKHFSNPGDFELVSSIFGLKKVAVSEIDKAGKAAILDQFDKSKSLTNRQRLESAEFLNKLIVNIIKMFKLAEPPKQKKEDGEDDPAGDAVVQSWESSELKGI